MQTLSQPLTYLHETALDSAIRSTLGTRYFGLSTFDVARPVNFYLDDAATPADLGNTLAVVATHDPVFLSVDKSTISANGTDTATLTIYAPKTNPSPVTVLVAGTAIPVTLVLGIATLTITAATPGPISASIQNPTNRSTDVITIQAV